MTQTTRLDYQARIDALRETKREHTDRKIAAYGHFDVDDHGCIPWPHPVPFTATPNHPSGGCYGIQAIGENFRRWLEVHPVYIHPASAIAGAWIYRGVPGVAGFNVADMDSRGKSSARRTLSFDGYPRSWRPEHRPTHLYEAFLKYNTYAPGIGLPNHLGPDITIGLSLGWGGLLQNVRHHRTRNRPADTSFYDGEENLILGVQTWIRRHVEHAREMAKLEDEPAARQNLETIASMNEYLIDGPPRTFREAVQLMGWFQCIDRMWALGGALGQLDELLLPYYEADIASGCETDESIIWELCSLFFNDTHYSQIGGRAPDGHDLTSRMSFLILEAMHRIRIPTNIALRVHEGMDRALLTRAIEYMIEDGTGVDFALSSGLDRGFARNGVPIGLARMRAKVGCNWTALPGIEYGSQDGTRLCLVTPLLVAIDEACDIGKSAETDTAAGLDEASAGPATMDALWKRYEHHLGAQVAAVKQGKDIHMEHQAENYPEIVLNLFCHGPVERGLDVSAGGVDIVDLAMDGIGLATVADSFAAIEARVFDEQRITLEELRQALRANFAGNEQTRLMLAAVPRYGSGDSRADAWARRIADLWTRLVRDTPTKRGGFVCMPGLFSHGGTKAYGELLGATPNGRRAGEPVSHSGNPDPGFSPGGGIALTAKANSVASIQSGWGNTTPLQIELDTRLATSMGGVDAVAGFVLAHERQGGTLINMNIVSREHVLEAHEDPATHPDLMIRVTGYSAYFNTLSREYRQPIVDRIIAGD